MRSPWKALTAFGVASLLTVTASVGLAQPAQAACNPESVRITYTGAKGDPDYARLTVGCSRVKVYIDKMKSGKTYKVSKRAGDLKVYRVVINDFGSYVEIRLWFYSSYFTEPDSVAMRATNASAASTIVL